MKCVIKLLQAMSITYADLHRRFRKFQVGDMVMLRNRPERFPPRAFLDFERFPPIACQDGSLQDFEKVQRRCLRTRATTGNKY